MAITNAAIAALPTYSAAEQLKLWQKASVDLASAGISYAINGRTLTRNDWQAVKDAIAFWTEQVQIESGDFGGTVALAQFADAV